MSEMKTFSSQDAPLKRHMGLKTARNLSNTLIHILLIVISIIWLVPFVCILLQSFRVESTHQVGYVIPKQWGFDNYVNLLNTDFPRWYLNTLIIALCAAVMQTFIVLCMSYALSRFRFKMRKPLMRIMLMISLRPSDGMKSIARRTWLSASPGRPLRAHARPMRTKIAGLRT